MIELLITLVVAVIVMGAVFSLTLGIMGSVEENRQNDGIGRSARLVGMSLARDFQETGVLLESTLEFGSLNIWQDTVVILRVPFEPAEAPAYPLKPPSGTNNPLSPGGTCGVNCVDLNKVNSAFDLQPGDLARLQSSGERRLILVERVDDLGSSVQVTFSADSLLLNYPAGVTGGLALDRFATFVQKLAPVVYYQDSDVLRRAESLNSDGTPDGVPLVYGIQSWEAWLRFVDGDEAKVANVIDSDETNDFDDLLGAKIDAVLGADLPILRADTTGARDVRRFEWQFTPRNLMYEKPPDHQLRPTGVGRTTSGSSSRL